MKTTSTRRIGKIEWKILSISPSVPVRDDVECVWGRFQHDDWWLPFQVIIFNGPIGFRSEIFHLSCRRIISSFTRCSRAAVGQSTFNIENIICRTRLPPWHIERERYFFGKFFLSNFIIQIGSEMDSFHPSLPIRSRRFHLKLYIDIFLDFLL